MTVEEALEGMTDEQRAIVHCLLGDVEELSSSPNKYALIKDFVKNELDGADKAAIGARNKMQRNFSDGMTIGYAMALRRVYTEIICIEMEDDNDTH